MANILDDVVRDCLVEHILPRLNFNDLLRLAYTNTLFAGLWKRFVKKLPNVVFYCDNSERCITNFPSLEILNIESNLITEDQLLQLSKLKCLKIGPNNRNITSNCISRLTNLTRLDLVNTSISQGLISLSAHGNLRYLVVEQQTISSAILSQLTSLVAIQVGYMENTGILTTLPNLKALILGSNNNINDPELRKLTNLTYLHRGDNQQITVDGLTVLTNLTELYPIYEGDRFYADHGYHYLFMPMLMINLGATKEEWRMYNNIKQLLLDPYSAD